MLYSIVGVQEARSGGGSLERIHPSNAHDPPCTCFTCLLTVGPFYPSWWKNPETGLGNGVFYLTDYADGGHYCVMKNPYFLNADAVNIDTIEVRLVYDLQVAYQTGEADVATDLPEYIALHMQTALSRSTGAC